MTAPDPQDAAAWVARLHSDQHTEADRQAFRAWVEADPARARAYAEAEALWDDIGALATDPAARALLLAPARPVRSPRLKLARALGGGAATLAAAAAVAAVVVWTGGLSPGERFTTGPGRLRTVALVDGSTLTLDAGSAVRASFTAGERRMTLERGRAFFRVAKDSARPFRVFVGADEVRAVGTAFEVRRLGDHAEVVLEEGRLAVFHSSGAAPRLLSRIWTRPPPAKGAGAPAPSFFMTTGQETHLSDQPRPAVVRANLAQAQAWRYGRLVLDETPLAEVAAELNADGGPRIVLADPSLGEIRVSGVFHRGRPRDVVSAVSQAFPVRVARDDGDEILLARR